MRLACQWPTSAPCKRQISARGPVLQHVGHSSSSLQQRPSVCCAPLAPRRPVQAQAAKGDAGATTGGKVLWYQKNKELWRELASEEDFAATLADLAPGQLLVVDYYAGWCAVCKSSYPNLCRIISDPKIASGAYLFAKGSLDHPDIKARIKREGIAGIPWIGIYNKQGDKVASFGAAFKRLEAVRHNLNFLADHKDQIQLAQPDPNGFLIIPGVSCPLPPLPGISVTGGGSNGASEATSPLASSNLGM